MRYTPLYSSAIPLLKVYSNISLRIFLVILQVNILIQGHILLRKCAHMHTYMYILS